MHVYYTVFEYSVHIIRIDECIPAAPCRRLHGIESNIVSEDPSKVNIRGHQLHMYVQTALFEYLGLRYFRILK